MLSWFCSDRKNHRWKNLQICQSTLFLNDMWQLSLTHDALPKSPMVVVNQSGWEINLLNQNQLRMWRHIHRNFHHRNGYPRCSLLANVDDSSALIPHRSLLFFWHRHHQSQIPEQHSQTLRFVNTKKRYTNLHSKEIWTHAWKLYMLKFNTCIRCELHLLLSHMFMLHAHYVIVNNTHQSGASTTLVLIICTNINPTICLQIYY